MNRNTRMLCRELVVGLAMLACVSLAQARDTMLLLPIEPVLKQAATRQLLGSGVALRFGHSEPEGNELVVEGHGAVKPHVGYSFNKEIRLSDEEACQQAFRLALADMVRAVRQSGGSALVGVVSNHRGSVMGSPVQFECHAGITKALVDLQGRAAKSVPVATAKPAPAAAVKNAAPQRGGEEGSAESHHEAVPAATGFAAANDADAVPLRDEGKARYRHYLTLPSPKAFVVYESGGWRFFWNDPDAMTKALDRCAKEGKPCWLYAVDDRVVWSADAGKRIGSSAQLRGQ